MKDYIIVGLALFGFLCVVGLLSYVVYFILYTTNSVLITMLISFALITILAVIFVIVEDKLCK